MKSNIFQYIQNIIQYIIRANISNLDVLCIFLRTRPLSVQNALPPLSVQNALRNINSVNIRSCSRSYRVLRSRNASNIGNITSANIRSCSRS